MASYFPTPYADELLYSIKARYHVRSGNTSPKATIEELFGSITASAVIDLPCNLDVLVRKIPSFMNISFENILYRHTLFPYYAAFLPNDRVDMLMKSMKSEHGGDIHTRTGIMASNIKVPEFLKFCPECNEQSYKKYGEFYWNRIHQIPCVYFCPFHKVLLQDSSVNIHDKNKNEYIAANKENCRLNPEVIIWDSNDTNKLISIAQDTVWLLQNYENIRSNDEIDIGLRNQYLSILKEKGLASINGRVYQAELIKAFKDFYGESFLKTVQSDIDNNFENNWLSSIVRKHRKAFHPMRHLLLIRFLFGDNKEFFYEKQDYKPFGFGPWLCLNAAAEHYGKPVVMDIVITHCYDIKLPVGTFKCSCGFIYSRRGPDKSKEDTFKVGRIKQFGPVWEDKLRELVENENLSMREIARRLEVDPNTVKKYVIKLKIKAIWFHTSDISAEGFSDTATDSESCLRSYHRRNWQESIQNNPGVYKTDLRKINKATYTWLYRHDQEWLDENSPTMERAKVDYKRVDWDKRDTEVVLKVKQAVNELLSTDDKPHRITVSTIGKKIGLLSLLEKHIDKLPGTKKYLDVVSESIEGFQVRRVKWCANQIRLMGEEVKEWKIIRMAGLRPDYSIKVQRAIDEAIYQNNFGLKAIE